MFVVSDGKNKFKIFELDSKSELSQYLTLEDPVLGSEKNESIVYYIVEIYFKKIKKAIGIMSSGNGLKPTLTFLDSNNIVLSVDNFAYFLDNKKNEFKILKVICTTLVFEIVKNVLNREVFIICEAHIYKTDFQGNLIWNYSADGIIEDYKFDNNFLKLIIIKKKQ